MKIKVLHIRLSREHIQADEAKVNEFLDAVVVKRLFSELIQGTPNYWTLLFYYEEMKPPEPRIGDKLSISSAADLSPEDLEVFELLKQWRADKALVLNIPPFMICHNSELMSIAKFRPHHLEELGNIKGFGTQKLTKIGPDILAVLNAIGPPKPEDPKELP